MKYDDIRSLAKAHMSLCKACPVCNGAACGHTIPGPGAKGLGRSAMQNYQAWQDVFLNMDTITEEKPVDTRFSLFGYEFAYPIFAAPMGAVPEHLGNSIMQKEYDIQLIKGCKQAGIMAFTGDGLKGEYYFSSCETIKEFNSGVPTMKPWSRERVFERIDAAKAAGVKMLCMDIDGSGLPFLKNANPPSGTKTVEQLQEIIEYAGVPFIIKGIMTPEGARKAEQAGASGIIVSNHGGRVLDQTPATAWVLPAIAEAIDGRITVLVDGGIRTGLDVFKALALGADAVMIGRPFGVCVYGGGADAVECYVHQLGAELRDAMQMCGPRTLAQINESHIWRK